MYIASVQFSSIVRVCATTPPKAKCSKDCCDVSLINYNALQLFAKFTMISKLSLSMHLIVGNAQSILIMYYYALSEINYTGCETCS